MLLPLAQVGSYGPSLKSASTCCLVEGFFGSLNDFGKLVKCSWRKRGRHIQKRRHSSLKKKVRQRVSVMQVYLHFPTASTENPFRQFKAPRHSS